MATGWQSTATSDRNRIFRLVDALTGASVAAPTASTDGVSWETGAASRNPGMLARESERCMIAIYNTAGSGVLAITYVRLWGYIKDLDKWFPIGTGTDADKGKVNDAVALGEVAADTLRHIEVLSDLSVFDKLHAEVSGAAGTTPSYNIDLIFPRHIARAANP